MAKMSIFATEWIKKLNRDCMNKSKYQDAWMLLDHNFKTTNIFEILSYWQCQPEECNQNLQKLIELEGKKYYFRTLK